MFSSVVTMLLWLLVPDALWLCRGHYSSDIRSATSDEHASGRLPSKVDSIPMHETRARFNASRRNGGELVPIHEVTTIRDCGARAVQACLFNLGVDSDLTHVKDYLPNRGDFASLQELAHAVSEFGCSSRGIKWTQNVEAGCTCGVLQVGLAGGRQHFIAAILFERERLLIEDAGRQMWVSHGSLRASGWDGTVLHIAATDANLPSASPSSRYPSPFAIAVSLLAALAIAHRMFMRSARLTSRFRFGTTDGTSAQKSPRID
jgi:hypothetical protein